MTTVKLYGEEVRFDVALAYARSKYLAGKNKDIKKMTDAELEKRLEEVRLYHNLMDIKNRTESRGAIECAAFAPYRKVRMY